MKAIDKKTVQHVAHLSRLEFDESQLELYSAQLATILAYIDKLNEVDTASTQPTSHPLAILKNVFRKDILKPSISPDDALSSAPAKDGSFFVVPLVIEGK
ncbi:MAG: Asp-tRNA(Asn)/Glu-tRNA(Gln) amidotransferase subunit GatC [Candidatus Omnitrophica bacterium]|nr:Asp-tRNA(Asn)/Glu-tRNA(Gln) amidotransferase subunit GatC [Candidatus Omnitrophota bacterium]